MKILSYIFPVCVLIFLSIYSLSAEKNPAQSFLDTDTKKISYAIGQQVAASIKTQIQDLDNEALLRAVSDSLSAKPSLLSDQEIKDTLQKWQTAQMEKQKQDAVENGQKGIDFLAENKMKAGVKTTDSGLQYEILEPGNGAVPAATDKVKVHYKGTLIDGTEFDSSYKRGEPVTFGLNQVIKGWTEGLQLIKSGGKIKLYIPAELAYGAMQRPGIPANSTLIFDVELLEIAK